MYLVDQNTYISLVYTFIWTEKSLKGAALQEWSSSKISVYSKRGTLAIQKQGL